MIFYINWKLCGCVVCVGVYVLGGCYKTLLNKVLEIIWYWWLLEYSFKSNAVDLALSLFSATRGEHSATDCSWQSSSRSIRKQSQFSGQNSHGACCTTVIVSHYQGAAAGWSHCHQTAYLQQRQGRHWMVCLRFTSRVLYTQPCVCVHGCCWECFKVSERGSSAGRFQFLSDSILWGIGPHENTLVCSEPWMRNVVWCSFNSVCVCVLMCLCVCMCVCVCVCVCTWVCVCLCSCSLWLLQGGVCFICPTSHVGIA